MIMLHDLRVTVCVCSEGSALFHIITDSCGFLPYKRKNPSKSCLKRSVIYTVVSPCDKEMLNAHSNSAGL